MYNTPCLNRCSRDHHWHRSGDMTIEPSLQSHTCHSQTAADNMILYVISNADHSPYTCVHAENVTEQMIINYVHKKSETHDQRIYCI